MRVAEERPRRKVAACVGRVRFGGKRPGDLLRCQRPHISGTPVSGMRLHGKQGPQGEGGCNHRRLVFMTGVLWVVVICRNRSTGTERSKRSGREVNWPGTLLFASGPTCNLGHHGVNLYFRTTLGLGNCPRGGLPVCNTGIRTGSAETATRSRYRGITGGSAHRPHRSTHRRHSRCHRFPAVAVRSFPHRRSRHSGRGAQRPHTAGCDRSWPPRRSAPISKHWIRCCGVVALNWTARALAFLLAGQDAAGCTAGVACGASGSSAAR